MKLATILAGIPFALSGAVLGTSSPGPASPAHIHGNGNGGGGESIFNMAKRNPEAEADPMRPSLDGTSDIMAEGWKPPHDFNLMDFADMFDGTTGPVKLKRSIIDHVKREILGELLEKKADGGKAASEH